MPSSPIPAFLLLRRGQMRLDLCKLSAFVAEMGFECELLTKTAVGRFGTRFGPRFSRAGKASDRI